MHCIAGDDCLRYINPESNEMVFKSVDETYTPVTKVSGQPKQNGVEFDR